MDNVVPLPGQAVEAVEGAETFTETWQQAVDRLAKLSPIEYDRVRQAEAEKLEARVTTLDAEVEKLRGKDGGGDDGQGSEVTFPVFEPHPLPVDGGALLADLAAAVLRYVVMQPEAADAVALWVMHAHCHDAADTSPVLAITSPEKRCGKTTLLMVLGKLVPKAMPSANITPSAVFRSIAKWKPTLLIDEADTFLSDNEDLRGVLNSGQCRSAAYVTRTVGEDHDPRRFATWAPKAVAMIGKLPGTLADRSIAVALQRKGAGEGAERFRVRSAHGLDALHRMAVRWAGDHSARLIDADPPTPDALHDRAGDNWRPLLAIADLAGGEWPARARAAALALSGGDAAEDQSRGAMLLADIRAVFEERAADRIASADLAHDLAGMEERPWPEWQQGKPITPRQVARLLAPFGIGPKPVRIAGEPTKGYERSQFEDAWTRYLPSSPGTSSRSVTTVTALNANVFPESRSVTGCAGVTDRNSEVCNENKRVTDVTDQSPLPRTEGGVAGTEPERRDPYDLSGRFGNWADGDPREDMEKLLKKIAAAKAAQGDAPSPVAGDFQPTCFTPEQWERLKNDPTAVVDPAPSVKRSWLL